MQATNPGNANTVVGVFEDRQKAQQAVNELKQAGFREDQIGIVAHDEGRQGQETGGEEGNRRERERRRGRRPELAWGFSGLSALRPVFCLLLVR